VHEPFGDWESYADFVDLLTQTDSVIEETQLWWSVRPHHAFGTVEVRICDAQTSGDDSLQLAALTTACVAQAALDYDDRGYGELLRDREIEENLWRAIRRGMDGAMIDFAARREVPTRAVAEGVLEWTAPARDRLGIEVELPERNGAQRSLQALAAGAPIEEIYRDAIEETRRTYAPQTVAAAAEASS
jgi:carboxylate-amine ligase